MFTENISPDLVVKVSVSCVKIISIACAKEDEQDVIVEKVELFLGIVIWSEETVADEKICIGLQIFFCCESCCFLLDTGQVVVEFELFARVTLSHIRLFTNLC